MYFLKTNHTLLDSSTHLHFCHFSSPMSAEPNDDPIVDPIVISVISDDDAAPPPRRRLPPQKRRLTASSAASSAASSSAAPPKKRVKKTMTKKAQQAIDDHRKLVASLKCPITHRLFVDPVTLFTDGRRTDGYVYENAAIRHWLRTKRTSPMTRATVKSPTDCLMYDRRVREQVELCVEEGWAEPSEIEQWKDDCAKHDARKQFYSQWRCDEEKYLATLRKLQQEDEENGYGGNYYNDIRVHALRLHESLLRWRRV